MIREIKSRIRLIIIKIQCKHLDLRIAKLQKGNIRLITRMLEKSLLSTAEIGEPKDEEDLEDLGKAIEFYELSLMRLQGKYINKAKNYINGSNRA